ncbi:MAG: sulfur carrier protein ThiS [Methanobrevibacter boviskoreani]|jgi:sulfur carrier protein|uniref:sulfur carrier protein ThiS n=1 Tax=Methanobrevibacter TaxID=2172 RepID=UPI0003348B63|nr:MULTISPECIES: sulfur carrier protein ThiS [Methanobrevibacter]AGN17298.1 thiamine biosynthesis protein ThiS [Methanobrevibacter sp. AbM4]MCI6774800.1 sulfur carrier protein ThiS [Methanobrevibacter boviskoreani]MCI6930966.1 sulfur carrier protein ThiS [Methanobrevibacter boviskoreani]MDD6256088.1 sulfur carrier protein ThiS [Methanobrevibacter boviskoreani]MDY5615069.1 sulfur carrier protein ThiS [Methanobrevibacter boviskoreani]
MSYTVIYKDKKEERELNGKYTIQNLLDDLDISSETIVPKQNGDIVVEESEIHDGDEIKIIQIIYGG